MESWDKTDATVENLIRVIGRQAVRIAELEAENISIRASTSHGADAHGVKRVEPRPDNLLDNANLPNISLHTYEQLSRKHAELLARYEQLESHFAIREKKYREAKDVAKQWKAYVNRKFPIVGRSRSLSRLSKAAKEREDECVPQSQNNLKTEASNPLDPAIETSYSDEDLTKHTLPEHPSIRTRRASAEPLGVAIESRRARRQSIQVTSSQTTESLDAFEDTPLAAIKREPSSDDSPVTVRTRQLKRKASPSLQAATPRRIKQEPTSPGGDVEFNSQKYSSPHMPPVPLQHHETSDLNAIGLHIGTPRKPRLDLHLGRHASSKPTTRHCPTTSHNRPSLEAERHSHKKVPVTNMTEASRSRHDAQDIMASCNRGDRLAQAPGSPSGAVLQQRSVNLPAPHPIRRALDAAKQDCKESEAAFEGLHEGHDAARSQIENIERSPEVQTKPDEPAAARLDALLADHTPSVRRSLAGGTRPSAAKDRKRQIPSLESTPMSADKGSPPADHQKTAKVPRVSGTSTPATKAKEPPLRSRPLSELQLEDFKINPNYLGTDFAYRDTLRGRDQRRALQTCTRPECCGETFRRVIEIGGTSVSGKSDAVALEEYLGPSWQETVGSYGPEKRREVLVEAHVHCFARDHGRHRHAFQRRSTPPGFWRTDMPTTQEAEEDRVRAWQAGREKVEERWREARRDGGRWLFRDE